MITPVLISLFATYTFLWLHVTVHELGHALMARFVGMEVYVVNIGGGYPRFSFQCGSFPVIVGSYPCVGSCAVHYHIEQTRVGKAAMCLGGFLADLAVFPALFLILYAFAPITVWFAAGAVLIYSLVGDIHGAFHPEGDLQSVIQLGREKGAA